MGPDYQTHLFLGAAVFTQVRPACKQSRRNFKPLKLAKYGFTVTRGRRSQANIPKLLL
jgi:hypothetical protein